MSLTTAACVQCDPVPEVVETAIKGRAESGEGPTAKGLEYFDRAASQSIAPEGVVKKAISFAVSNTDPPPIPITKST